MNNNLIKHYAQLKIEAKKLEEEIKSIQPQVMEEMADYKELEIPEMGKLVKASRRAWTYPEHVKRAEEKVKEMKKEAEQTGDAEYIENPYLVFKHEA